MHKFRESQADLLQYTCNILSEFHQTPFWVHFVADDPDILNTVNTDVNSPRKKWPPLIFRGNTDVIFVDILILTISTIHTFAALFENIVHVNYSCLFFLLIPEWKLLHWIHPMGVWSSCYHTIIIPSDKTYIISTVRDFILPLSHLHHLFPVSNGSFSIISSLSASTIFKSYLALVPQQFLNPILP